jgi:hypothetical protein
MSKPSDTEEEYFARENAERMRKLAAEQKKSLAEGEREKLRQLHHMRCPKCGMELREIAVGGVQVDRCFSCNGTWLDAGELEKLAKGQGEGSVMASVLRVFGGGKK